MGAHAQFRALLGVVGTLIVIFVAEDALTDDEIGLAYFLIACNSLPMLNAIDHLAAQFVN